MAHPRHSAFEGALFRYTSASLPAIAAAFAGYLALLEPVSQMPAAGFRHLSATLPAMVLALVAHLALSRMLTIPCGLRGYEVLPAVKTVAHKARPAE